MNIEIGGTVAFVDTWKQEKTGVLLEVRQSVKNPWMWASCAWKKKPRLK